MQQLTGKNMVNHFTLESEDLLGAELSVDLPLGIIVDVLEAEHILGEPLGIEEVLEAELTVSEPLKIDDVLGE